MLKREWQKIAKNKWMLLILIAIITIPAIYTSVFLGSMWDPYGDADELPVAVINKDRKVDYNGTTLAVGDELVKNLKKTKALDFRFVSEKKAEDGLKSGKYYMIISIPEDFSENATTLMDENPRKMKLTYKTNPGTNYVASKMDDSAMAKIEKSVSEKVTETYAKTVFAQVKVAGKGFSKAADGAGKIEKGAKKLKKGNNTIEKNLRKLASSSLTFQNGAKTLSVGLRTYTNGVAQVDSGATSLQSGTKTLKNGTGSAKSGANSLASGAKTLQNGTGQLKNGAGQLSAGAKKLQSGSKSLKNGVSQYTAGVDSAKAGSSQLAANNSKLNNGVASLSEGSKKLSSGTQTLTTGIGGVLTAAQQTSDQIGNSLPAESDIQKLTSGMEELNAGIQKLNKALGNQETQAAVQTTKTTTTTAENEQSKQAAESASSAKQSVRVMQQKVSNLKNSSALKNLSEEEKEQLLSEIGEVENAASNVESNVDETYTKSQKAVQSKVTTTTTTKQAKSGLTDTIQKMLELKQSVAKIAAASNQVLPTGEKAINSLYGGLKEVKTGLDKKGTTQSDMGMIQALTALKSGATEVQKGMASMESGINDSKNGLSIGIANYTNGVKQLDNGLTKLSKNSKALNSGASQLNSGINQVSVKLPEFMTGINKLYAGSGTLASGANQLASGIGKLDSGAGQLYDGTKTLKAGTGKLVANNSTLNNGVTQLASGAGQISNGSTKLANGSTTLGNGLGTLTDGSKTLKDSLQKGADQVNDIKTTNKTNKMFAAPVKTNNVEYSHVQNNGHAMAPYMMSVGLFVACMAFTLMYPLMERNEEVKTGLQWWLSKVTVMAAISIAQAVIMVGVLMVVNGLEPNYVGKTFGMAILASMAFMSLIAFFEMMINRVGSYVLLVFMVIQLGAAGGTYPLNMAPHFYTVLHKYMPFSYTVHAFRHTLSMDGKIGGDVAVFVGILVVSTLATILLYRFRMKKQVGGTLEVDGPAVQH